MGGRDKLGLKLRGRSVLRWSIEALAEAGVERIAVVTSPSRIPAVAAAGWLPDSVIAVVAGGERRQESVAAGFAALVGADAGLGLDARSDAAAMGQNVSRPDPIILVHDAARPLASAALIRDVAAAVASHGAAIPVLPVAETLKRLAGDRIVDTVDRTDVVAAQTPQGVRRSLLERAYAAYPAEGPETWTDEASLLEACRIPVHAIAGEATNLKLTLPFDLQRAQALLDGGLVPGYVALPTERPTVRVGFGTDSHPFGPDMPLVLGGLTVEGAPRLTGHSDGDVVLHAVADALLGAAGLGDLGRLFPADSRTPAGIDSRVLLADVVARVRAACWRPGNLDVTIVASRPRLAHLLPEMAGAIAAILGLDGASVNVKASTANLGGPEGSGRRISASAIVSLVAVGPVAAEGEA
jgi:2-C-methyl-D-erythritol 4-phosphate cytidylyltransferase/2-C-methyl-D-erythritol 2,4-cyclodiphosphate synthase